ncbi:ABC transporter ATP-binding protein [Candidatus Sulfurimonas marisnigri]|uniref:ABC transporter ATP-binding protein n=1 Tax=Candidatus Sulfurimonas marisnigri TaxID=2740405 RepID=A0A7S7LZR9_9BACT|nr:ATP-binding cassette domain-containing protein [Candidatus Sulfurimonas marisnigri]QOY54427.1 ABC transporter ATP-binding protein [Candidatus Sulfurimonas marisnigri]
MNISKLHITLDDKTLVDISFNISSSLALVGQSGSGKSLTLKALLGMLPSSMEVELEFDCDFELRAGDSLAFVPQNPFTALSPLTKIHKQFFTSLEKAESLFTQVGLEAELLQRFPPELSGGQLQRVIIAMALESEPKLLLLDEPTTALDPKTRVMILELLKKLQKEFGFKILFVTHDMNSAKSLCEDICVIKNGKVMEIGDMQTILQNPTVKYTKTLIEANFANRNFRI